MAASAQKDQVPMKPGPILSYLPLTSLHFSSVRSRYSWIFFFSLKGLVVPSAVALFLNFPCIFKILKLWKSCKNLLENPHSLYPGSPDFNILPHFLCLSIVSEAFENASSPPNISVYIVINGLFSHATTIQVSNSGNFTLM